MQWRRNFWEISARMIHILIVWQSNSYHTLNHGTHKNCWPRPSSFSLTLGTHATRDTVVTFSVCYHSGASVQHACDELNCTQVPSFSAAKAAIFLSRSKTTGICNPSTMTTFKSGGRGAKGGESETSINRSQLNHARIARVAAQHWTEGQCYPDELITE